MTPTPLSLSNAQPPKKHVKFKPYLASPDAWDWSEGPKIKYTMFPSSMPLPVAGVPSILEEPLKMQPGDACKVRPYCEDRWPWGTTVSGTVRQEVLSIRAGGGHVQTYVVEFNDYVQEKIVVQYVQVVPFLGEVWPEKDPAPEITRQTYVTRRDVLRMVYFPIPTQVTSISATGSKTEEVTLAYPAIVKSFVRVPYPITLTICDGPYKDLGFQTFSVLPCNWDTAEALEERGYIVFGRINQRCIVAPCDKVVNGDWPKPQHT